MLLKSDIDVGYLKYSFFRLDFSGNYQRLGNFSIENSVFWDIISHKFIWIISTTIFIIYYNILKGAHSNTVAFKNTLRPEKRVFNAVLYEKI